jgi:hypothetical protein
MMLPKSRRFEDRRYLDWLRTQRCVLTGLYGNDSETVDPMHIGTLGRGMKAHDYWALPVIHRLHAEAHQHGEARMFRMHLPDDVMISAMRAYAREMFERNKR